MEKNTLHMDTERTRIMKDYYRPSPNLIRFFKSLALIVMKGESPIRGNSYPRIKNLHNN